MKQLLVAFLLLYPMSIYADGGALEEVLAHIRRSAPARFEYQEVRTLELADAPVHTAGYMLTDTEGTLVKLQQQPSRVIMAIAGDSMFYWDPVLKQRHRAPLAYGGAAAQQITVFRALLQGRIGELQAAYDMTAETHDQHWTLRLTPKSEDQPVMEITGSADDGERNIQVRQSDGEASAYRIVKMADSADPQPAIAELLREAAGE
ncbi:MAG: outer membrane lipoprotein carrier protein LolA [Methylomonas sp.]|nr:outer membrane lipoprotein carrier protein LolA [Methylomonas sp.]